MHQADPWLSRYAKFLVVYTVFLIFVGAMVTTLGVGLAVPDWPTTFGYNMFTYPIDRWVDGVFWEHSHRIVASVLGVLMIVLAVWVTLKEKRHWVRVLAWSALVVVCIQGVMGGYRVTKISISWAILHGCTAQLFFCMMVLIAAVLSSRWGQPAQGRIAPARLRSISLWAWIVTGAVYLQLILGAAVRHRDAGLAIQTFPLNPDGSFLPSGGDPNVHLHFTHRLWAVVVTAVIITLAVKIFRHARQEPRLLRSAIALLVMVTIQISFGAMIIWYLQASIPTSGHVINGALILAVSFLIGVRATQFARLGGQSPAAQSTAPPEAVQA